MKPLYAWGMLGVALFAWGGFAYMVSNVYAERAKYVTAALAYEEESLRGESATRLRVAVRDTESERTALTNAISISLLDVAETIEAAGYDAGATKVSIGEATPIAKPPKNLSIYTFVVNAEGSFVALMRALYLLESLPIPSSIEQYEIAKTDKTWRLSARLKTTLAVRK